jgi:hypothetical protein
MLPAANQIHRNADLSKEEWIAHLQPYVDEMPDQTEATIDATLCDRRLGLQLDHWRQPDFVKAWIELRQPFTKKMSKGWHMFLHLIFNDYDGEGHSEVVASDQFWLIARSPIGFNMLRFNKFCGNYLFHHPKELSEVPDVAKKEMIALLRTGVRAAKVTSMFDELSIAEKECKAQKCENEKNSQTIKDQEDTIAFLRENAVKSEKLIGELMIKCQKLTDDLAANVNALKDATANVTLLKGIIHPPVVVAPTIQGTIQSTIRAAATTPPANHPPTNGSVSWNVSYASQERNDNGPPIVNSSHNGANKVNDRGHQQRQGNGHENHGRQQHQGSGRPHHQGRGYQKRYRDNNGNYSEYHADSRRGYYGGGRGEGHDYHN